jgi:5-formyltetrahydrofolate cyclo-ligase
MRLGVSQSIACNPSGNASGNAKTTLRASLLGARKSLTDRAARDSLLAQRLSEWLARQAPHCVAFYWPIAGEFDARGVIEQWLGAGPHRQAALPVVLDRAAPLGFHAWRPGAAMRPGRFGIPVPAEAVTCQPDVILIPCVGFDAARFRLGYGGGYYDRTLAAIRDGTAADTNAGAGVRDSISDSTAESITPGTLPLSVGIGYECGRVDQLPVETHDIPLDVILSDAATYR